jgi:DNA-binding XRE family transcriptional regulator
MPIACGSYLCHKEEDQIMNGSRMRYGNTIPPRGILIKKIVHPRSDPKAIGRRIREIRGFDLTQSEFGKILGIGQTQLSKYEMGQSAPTLDILLKLKAYSGRTIDWIVTGVDEGPRK